MMFVMFVVIWIQLNTNFDALSLVYLALILYALIRFWNWIINHKRSWSTSILTNSSRVWCKIAWYHRKVKITRLPDINCGSIRTTHSRLLKLNLKRQMTIYKYGLMRFGFLDVTSKVKVNWRLVNPYKLYVRIFKNWLKH